MFRTPSSVCTKLLRHHKSCTYGKQLLDPDTVPQARPVLAEHKGVENIFFDFFFITRVFKDSSQLVFLFPFHSVTTKKLMPFLGVRFLAPFLLSIQEELKNDAI
jgi:hypothetical protein